MAFRHLRLRPI